MQVLVSVSDMSLESQVPLGVVLSLFSALFYAAYLVFLRRKVENEDKMDIPLFFGNYINKHARITDCNLLYFRFCWII